MHENNTNNRNKQIIDLICKTCTERRKEEGEDEGRKEVGEKRQM